MGTKGNFSIDGAPIFIELFKTQAYIKTLASVILTPEQIDEFNYIGLRVTVRSYEEPVVLMLRLVNLWVLRLDLNVFKCFSWYCSVPHERNINGFICGKLSVQYIIGWRIIRIRSLKY